MKDEFMKRWQFVRSETLEILTSLDQVGLAFTPTGEKWQPMYAQFSCIGKTQAVYTRAVEQGTMDFGLFHSLELPHKEKFGDKLFAVDFLRSTNNAWGLATSNNNGAVKWPEETISVESHIMRLAEHERLHHGQLISYFTLAELDLPSQFKSNWAL